MTISLIIRELLFDIRNKSHLETASITDAESRYLIEAGTEKTDEIMRGISEAFSFLRSVFLRFLAPDCASSTDNLPLDDEVLVMDLDLSARRRTNRMQQLADMSHSYIVDRTLAKFYSSVSQSDLSAKHDKAAQATLSDIQALLYSKLPPIR